MAVAVTQIDRDPVVYDRLVDPTMEIAVANAEKNHYAEACRSRGIRWRMKKPRI
jgi:hypothetical protein